MKRLIAAPLWFLVGWYLGAAVSWALGLSPALGPVLAVAMAGLLVTDPRRLIWSGHSNSSSQP